MSVGGINSSNVNLELLFASKAESWKSSAGTREAVQQFVQRPQRQGQPAAANGSNKVRIGRNQSANLGSGVDNASKAEQSKPRAAVRDEYVPGNRAVKSTGVYKLMADGSGGVQIIAEQPGG